VVAPRLAVLLALLLIVARSSARLALWVARVLRARRRRRVPQQRRQVAAVAVAPRWQTQPLRAALAALRTATTPTAARLARSAAVLVVPAWTSAVRPACPALVAAVVVRPSLATRGPVALVAVVPAVAAVALLKTLSATAGPVAVAVMASCSSSRGRKR
jgi:hypothetical protein